MIRQLRAALPEVDILPATDTFGTTDLRDAGALVKAPHSGTGPYGRALQNRQRFPPQSDQGPALPPSTPIDSPA